MAVQPFERLGRRLRQQHEKLHRAVGTRIEGLELRLYEHWDQDLERLRVLRVSTRSRVPLDVTRRVAQAVLGKSIDFERVVPGPYGGGFDVAYAVRMDHSRIFGERRGGRGRVGGEVQLRRTGRGGDWWQMWPAWVRWFDARQLGRGLGEGDDGALSWPGRRVVRE